MTENVRAARIPIVAEHRGVGLHADQDGPRQELVRAEIDAVFNLEGRLPDLLDWVADRSKSPESRLLARALILAEVEIAAEKHRPKPTVNVEWLNAVTCALDSLKWRSKTHFDSLFGSIRPGNDPRGPVRRPARLAD